MNPFIDVFRMGMFSTGRKVARILLILVVFVLMACTDNDSDNHMRFTQIPPSQSGVSFNNALTESHQMNVIIYQDFYSGGGVAIGDINNDGLPDLFFTGNMVPARLYLNQGNLKFKDITKKAGLEKLGKGWFTGTTMVDINNDGHLDIFVGRSGLEAEENRTNLLLVNQGNGTFLEKAEEYGLDHAGYAVNATFFDYDNDGDLDMYLVNQGPEKYEGGDALALRHERHEFAGDKLYENTGQKFIDVTEEAGIFSSVIGFAHGVAAGDINDDGWEDLFVSNDFFEHDYLYLNNGDKTFREVTKSATRHISYYSMGNDMADYNNDGLLDIVVVDMVAEDNLRLKENLGGMKHGRFQGAVELGYHYQYMSNVLHLNQGNETFSEIGHLAGISSTDWSWAPVFADFNNDGLKDLYVTNGIRKDIRNIDWGNTYHQTRRKAGSVLNLNAEQWDLLLSSMPSKKVPNYMYCNNGDLTFRNMAREWGLDHPSFSNGMAYGDLDLDGDLDIVVNNIDEPASIFENQSERFADTNFLRIQLAGDGHNKLALGTKIKLYHSGTSQYQQHYITRGYRSSMEPVLHFGLGTDTLVSRIEIAWPDGRQTVIRDIPANQLLQVSIGEAADPQLLEQTAPAPLFETLADHKGIDFVHSENEYEDYENQPLLPYRYADMGPALAVGDVNGDDLDDFYVGGALRRSGALFIQEKNGSFRSVNEELWQQDRLYEDIGAVFFDADGDEDQDLYVVSGGNEFKEGSPYLQDRLYLNNGSGTFYRSTNALPEITSSGSRAVPSDFDQDGDIDLFVGGRIVPHNYPLPADSYLLENKGGTFEDVTEKIAPELRKLGLVTDAVWVDTDGDQDQDLVVVGEWMPITLFNQSEGTFNKANNETNGLQFSNGWWYSIAAHDFDGDGDMDMVAGNLGLNYKHKASPEAPFEVIYGDLDQNGKEEFVLAYYQDGNQYPVDDSKDLIGVIPSLREKFPVNRAFSMATLQEMFPGEMLAEMLQYKAYTFASSYIENQGDSSFRISTLPNEAQISNQNDIIVHDVDHDGFEDLILAGNLYSSEVETIRNDAGIGILLKGNGKGDFTPVPFRESGLYLDGDLKHMDLLRTSGSLLIIGARNKDTLIMVKIIRDQSPPNLP